MIVKNRNHSSQKFHISHKTLNPNFFFAGADCSKIFTHGVTSEQTWGSRWQATSVRTRESLLVKLVHTICRAMFLHCVQSFHEFILASTNRGRKKFLDDAVIETPHFACKGIIARIILPFFPPFFFTYFSFLRLLSCRRLGFGPTPS